MIARRTPSLDEAADDVFRHIAEWVASSAAWSDNLEELVFAYERFSLMRRAQRRRVNIPKENQKS
jgi:hypothetical protein